MLNISLHTPFSLYLSLKATLQLGVWPCHGCSFTNTFRQREKRNPRCPFANNGYDYRQKKTVVRLGIKLEFSPFKHTVVLYIQKLLHTAENLSRNLTKKNVPYVAPPIQRIGSKYENPAAPWKSKGGTLPDHLAQESI